MDPSNACLTMDTTVGNEIYFITSNRGGGHLEFRWTRRKRYLASKLNYCTKSVSHFQLVRLAMSGDINPNPGPSVVNKKCQTCGKAILRHHRAAPCESCGASYHLKCAKVSPADYKNIYLPAGSRKWQCTTCEYQWQVLRELPFANINISDIESFGDKQHDHLSDEEDEFLQENIRLENRRKQGNDILVCHLNINSIQNKFEELVTVIKKLKVHIIFIGETKIDSTYPNSQFSIPDYTLYRNDRKKGGGGILVYVSSSLPSKRIRLDYNYKTLEPIAVEIRIGSKDMIFIGIYRPPKPLTGSYQITLEEELSKICNWATLQRDSIAVLGDLNLDRQRPDKREGKLLLDLEIEQNLECLIDRPTRIEQRGLETTSTLIDVLLTNRPELFKYCGVYHPSLSDHALIYGIMKNKSLPQKPKIINFRSFKKFDCDKFKTHLSEVPWHVGDIFDDLDDRVYFWNTMMNSVIDEHLPAKKMRVRAKEVPHMTTNWKNAIRAKRRALANYLNNKSDLNWEKLRKCRNEATWERRKAIKLYWKEKSNHLRDNPRDFYRTFMPFLGSKTHAKNNEIHLKVDDNVIKDQSKVAETFVDFFATIADGIGGNDVDLLSETDFENHPSVQRIAQHAQYSHDKYLTLQPLNEAQVQGALESLNVAKATGYDSIPPSIVKIGASEIAGSLTALYNNCISKGKWPQLWKKGEWTPVFKREDPLMKENYRPITVLPAVDKVFEQLIAKQVNGMFDNRLGQCITAYRKTYSCESALINLIEHWKLAKDNKQLIGILSTDMSKAFDSLHPALLLSKLKAYGFHDAFIDLMRDYLCDRPNRVKLGSNSSSWRRVDRGCPQGSALGPLLWNIFQNDLCYEISQNLSMYADDHQIYEVGDNILEVNSNLNLKAEKASQWYESNLLKGNLSKYQTMAIGNTHGGDEICVNVKGYDIETLSSLKLLGVTIDNKLNFSEHITTACKKASQRTGVLLRLKNLVPTSAKLQLFKGAILPYLTYCHLTWHFCRASDCRKLERIQERALRAVFRDKKSTYQQLLKRAELTTLLERRLQDIALLMFKVKHGLYPKNVRDLFTVNTSRYNLRGSDFTVPRFNSVTYGKHSLRYLGPKLWKLLPEELRNTPSIQTFKKQIRRVEIKPLLTDGCRNRCPLCND